jgi:hypothetical protein
VGANVRWWSRSLAIGAGVGFGVGLVVGGTLGRVFMRLLFLARQDRSDLETAMGAIIGELTVGGTLAIAGFGAIAGMALGLAYVAVRGLLPGRLAWRTTLFVLGSTAFLLGIIVQTNLEDFGLLPVTLSLLLTAGSVALTALPVPPLVERFAPDRTRRPGPVAHAVVGFGMIAFLAFSAIAIAAAYAIEPPPWV